MVYAWSYMKNKRHRWTDDELIESGAKYDHKGDWKRSAVANDSVAYQMAIRRPAVFAKATAHMTPKAHPYSGSYVIYAYEFADHKVYVGLTFRPRERHAQHMVRGRVFEHIKVCPEYAHKILESEIGSPTSAGERERYWVANYKAQGWALLNESEGGSLGTIQVTKWTKEVVLAEAKKFQTKQEWIDKSQMSYRVAKREGWFDEASAHMPKRDARHLIGRVVSDETRAKQAAAAQRRTADPKWRAAHSAALKGRSLSQAHRDAIRRGMA